LLGAAFIRRNE